MLPLARFTEALQGYKEEMTQHFDDLILAASLVSKRTNVIHRDDNGLFAVQVSGTLEECIDTLENMLVRLKKIKEQRV